MKVMEPADTGVATKPVENPWGGITMKPVEKIWSGV